MKTNASQLTESHRGHPYKGIVVPVFLTLPLSRARVRDTRFLGVTNSAVNWRTRRSLSTNNNNNDNNLNIGRYTTMKPNIIKTSLVACAVVALAFIANAADPVKGGERQLNLLGIKTKAEA